MSLRTRLLLAFAAVVLIAIALLVFGLRQEMARRLSHEYQLRVDQVVEVIREDLARESAGIADRLASLESALLNDNRFRLAAVAGIEAEREYLLDYAGTAMRLTGLSMLQIQDGDGTDHQLRPLQERAWPRRGRTGPGSGQRARTWRS